MSLQTQREILSVMFLSPVWWLSSLYDNDWVMRVLWRCVTAASGRGRGSVCVWYPGGHGEHCHPIQLILLIAWRVHRPDYTYDYDYHPCPWSILPSPTCHGQGNNISPARWSGDVSHITISQLLGGVVTYLLILSRRDAVDNITSHLYSW